MLPESFSPVDIRQMHLNQGFVEGAQRVEQGDRGVAVGARIDDDALGLPPRLLDPVDQLALLVGLPEIGLEAQRPRRLPAIRLDFGEGRPQDGQDRNVLRPPRRLLGLNQTGKGESADAEVLKLDRDRLVHDVFVSGGVDIELTERPAVECALRATRSDGTGPDILTPAVEGLVVPERADLPSVSREAYECVRIECGIPVLGAELTESTIPAEAGQWIVDASVSFTKGCYLGQETVARIDAMGHVNQQLVGLVFRGVEIPAAGTELSAGGAVAGQVTSAALSPRLSAPLALAMVRRAHRAAGSKFDSPVGPCEVVPLPVAV